MLSAWILASAHSMIHSSAPAICKRCQTLWCLPTPIKPNNPFGLKSMWQAEHRQASKWLGLRERCYFGLGRPEVSRNQRCCPHSSAATASAGH